MLRLLLNWAIKSALIVVFSSVGWIALKSNGEVVTGLTWSTFAAAALLALAILVIGILTLIVTLGCAHALGSLTLGPIALWLASVIFPNLVGLTGFWYTVAVGFIVMFARIPAARRPD